MSNSEAEQERFTEDLYLDAELIKKIKDIQELPDEIIIKFLKVIGSLSASDFGDCTVNEH